MNVGNMGSKFRLAYTVIGDAVNRAFRFEDLNRSYQASASVIVGQRTAESVKDIIFQELDSVTVRGKSSTTRIFQPVCMAEDLTESIKEALDKHRSALENYYGQRYELAIEQFNELKAEGGSEKYYDYMIAKASSELAEISG